MQFILFYWGNQWHKETYTIMMMIHPAVCNNATVHTPKWREENLGVINVCDFKPKKFHYVKNCSKRQCFQLFVSVLALEMHQG